MSLSLQLCKGLHRGDAVRLIRERAGAIAGAGARKE
jgi:hypothetical protein